MNKEKRTYKAADFANYHNGTMPSVEMHALEKEALADPFLSDALDGYAATQTAESDLLALKKRLPLNEDEASISTGGSFIHNIWFRIAAMLIVILGVGYFYYNKYNDNEQILAENNNTVTDTLQIAETKVETVVLPPATISTTKPAENSNVIKEKIAEGPVIKMEDDKMMDEVKQFSVAEKVTTAVPTASENNVQSELEKRNLAPTNNNAQNYTRYYTQQGNVTDLKGGPLQNVSIIDKNSNTGTVTDNNGRFTLKTTDSNAFVSVGSVGYKSKEILLNNNRVQKITLDRKDDQLQEVVVVTALGTSRKKSEVSTKTVLENSLQGKVAGVDIKPQQQSQPDNKLNSKNLSLTKSDTIFSNTTAFNEYIKNNLIPLFDENNKALKGEILLSFDIDKNGYPFNINVISSTCDRCIEQAINLLKKGPLWINSILKKHTVSIKF